MILAKRTLASLDGVAFKVAIEFSRTYLSPKARAKS
jgi:hypothetical protein